MFRTLLVAAAGLAAMLAAPAQAGRTAIDQDENGNPTQTRLSGYCDLNGEDCDRPVALQFKGAAYTATFADGQTFSNFFVHGNGLLTFGASIDFFQNFEDVSFYDRIVNLEDVPVTAYDRTLVSVGQNNGTDPLSFSGYLPFFQSADYGIDANGTIFAEFYTCYAPGSACRVDPQRLTLTPTATGFAATVSGRQFGSDRGYVVGGRFVQGGDSFFIPATIIGLPAGAPEPASWALMIGGFGLAGAAARRRRAAIAATA